MHQKGRFFASETLNYAFLAKKLAAFALKRSTACLDAPFWGMDTNLAAGPPYCAGLQQS